MNIFRTNKDKRAYGYRLASIIHDMAGFPLSHQEQLKEIMGVDGRGIAERRNGEQMGFGIRTHVGCGGVCVDFHYSSTLSYPVLMLK
ncbi:hypothetical protein D3C73_1587710 [compost metagenome]